MQNYRSNISKHQPGSKKLGRKWVFQMNNNPLHTVKAVTKQIQHNKVNVLEWSSKSPDLNPIENLWADLKRRVQTRQPTNLSQFHQFYQEEWTKIPANYSEKLVEGNPKHLNHVVQFKGNAAKHERNVCKLLALKKVIKNDLPSYSGIQQIEIIVVILTDLTYS